MSKSRDRKSKMTRLSNMIDTKDKVITELQDRAGGLEASMDVMEHYSRRGNVHVCVTGDSRVWHW